MPFGSIAILGAGAVGGYYGARLAQAGNEVHFLFRSGFDHVRRRGLVIKSIDGDFALSPADLHIYKRATDMPRVDLVVVALKSPDNSALLNLLPPLLHKRTIILTLQNGLGNEEFLAEHFGAQEILGGVAFTCINRSAPGVIEHSDHGHIKLGHFHRSNLERAAEIAELFRKATIRAQAVEKLMETRWSKLTWNIPFNGLGALLDVTTDRLIATDHGIDQVTTLIEEVAAIAAAEGYPLRPDIAQAQIELTRTMGPYLTSTQLDRRHSRPMELDSIFVRPLELAHRHGVAAPNLKLLVSCLESLNNMSATEPP